MENASKALIIAGAILVSILIIGIGMAVIQATGGIQDQMGSSLNSQELETFNTKYTQHVGANKAGSIVRTLINTMIANNAEFEDYPVELELDGTAYGKDALSTSLSKVSSTKRYTIEVEMDKNGRVNKVIATAKSSSDT